MCISNGLDAGLISNARWKGFRLRDFLESAMPLSKAARVRLHGVDNYTDTIPLEKAMDPATLLAYEMNGAALPDRHGYPLRVIVPGYFGEKHVKWLTRIELTTADAKGFYEAQGWGPDFITPTRSRIDVPDHESRFSLGKLSGPIEVKGIAYGGDRGISRVELSFDDGKTWKDAETYYPGTKLSWACSGVTIGVRQKRAITCWSCAPPTAKAKRNNGNPSAAHFPARPGSIKSSSILRRRTARSFLDRRSASNYFWHFGHHAVVRPPIVAWRRGVRWRGQTPSAFPFLMDQPIARRIGEIFAESFQRSPDDEFCRAENRDALARV